MGDAVPRSANLGSYVEARANWLYDAFTVRRAWEASLFLGISGLGLAAASLGWLRAARSPRSWVDRALSAATLALLAGVLGTVLLEGHIRLGGISMRPFTELGVALLAVLLIRQAVEGWRRWRAGSGDRSLAERDWVTVLLGLAGFAFLLSLGPVVALGAFGRQPIDEGLYAWLWPYVLLFRAIRGPTRIGILVLFAAGLLAALGAKWLLASRRRAWGPALVGLLGLALVLEYARMPLPYRPETSTIRQVDAILRADRADVAVLEWPPNVEIVDVDAMFRSIGHGKRVVNGLSGFVPSTLRELSLLLSEPETPFDAEAQAALQRIYPLRYLVVRLADHHLAKVWQPTWHRLRRIHPPILRHRGTYGDTDLYEILAIPERGLVLERWVSYGFLVAHPVLEATVRPVERQPGRAAWVEVAVNDRPVVRAPLQEPHRLRLRLHPPFRRAAPNTIRLTYGYDRIGPTGDRHAIGTTGARSPVDLVVTSAGQPHGDAASVRVNAVEHARNSRGYNLVALDPAGRLLDSAAFDTFLEPDAAGRLARWIDGLSAGTIVAGAAKDEVSGRLEPSGARRPPDARGRRRSPGAVPGLPRVCGREGSATGKRAGGAGLATSDPRRRGGASGGVSGRGSRGARAHLVQPAGEAARQGRLNPARPAGWRCRSRRPSSRRRSSPGIVSATSRRAARQQPPAPRRSGAQPGRTRRGGRPAELGRCRRA